MIPLAAATRLTLTVLVPLLGSVVCLFQAFGVEPHIWMVGLGLIVVGLLWQRLARRLSWPAGTP